MDTTETGGFLELTEGLQVGGGRNVIWAPAEYLDGEFGGSVANAPNYQGVLVTESTLPENVMHDAASILLVPPDDNGTYLLNFGGFFRQGQIVRIITFGPPESDPFSLTLATPAEFYVGSNGYFPAPLPLNFTHAGQTATIMGVYNRKNALFGRVNAVIGTTSVDPTVAPPTVVPIL
jgi:hypothetical protein